MQKENEIKGKKKLKRGFNMNSHKHNTLQTVSKE